MKNDRRDVSQGNILIVDDTPANLQLLDGILTDQGYTVRPVPNGKLALWGARGTTPPDLILLDIMMPDMDGYKVCEQLKADEDTCNIPVIFLSALNDVLDKVKAFSAGGVDYITKPFQEQEVLARVETHLSLRHAQQTLQERNAQLEQVNRELTHEMAERKRAEQALHLAKEAAQEAQRAAEAANRAKSDFLANMSHEIRTPMNAVIGFTELMDLLITDPIQRSYLESIKTGGRSLLTLINDILDLSKIEAGKLEMHYEPTSITSIFHEIRQVFRQKIAEKPLDFLMEIEPAMPEYLLLDDLRVRQVLLNLVGNAIKFTPQGYIKLTASMLASPPPPLPSTGSGPRLQGDPPSLAGKRAEEGGLLDLIIAVEDSGIGIPEAQQSTIFAAFTQQDGQSVKRYGGTGLGLAITRRLVDMMGGTIALNSDLNTGSTFEIALKDVAVCAAGPKSPGDQGFDAEQIVFEDASILVVDDVAHNRALIVGCFRKTALEVIEAENGQQALMCAREQPPDVILMDLHMPVMDGFEATQRIKNSEDLRHIPVIALTATVLKEEYANIQAHGFDGYVKKPVTRSELFQELIRFLPYTEREPAARSSDRIDSLHETNYRAEIPVDTLKALPEIIGRLEGEFMRAWESARQHEVFGEIEDVACQLKEFGEQHSLNILTQFGSDLLQHVRNFDINQIAACLDAYPQLIEQLKLTRDDSQKK
ncbi:MAG: response regulator [bacterium]|nr:response regulator [bacterium]